MIRLLPGLVLLFGLLIHAAPVHSQPAAPPGAAADTGLPPGGETSVGCLLPLSGKYAPVGERALKGILTAAAQGPDGYRLIVKDIGSEGQNLASALDELLAVPGLSFIIGPIPSSYAAAAARAGRAKVPMIIFPASESESRGGPYVVEFFYPLEEQAKVLSSYAARDLGARAFGILYPETPAGRELAALFREAATGSGGKIVYEKGYPPGAADLSGEAEWIASIKPDAMFIPDGASVSAEIILRLKQNPRLSDVLFLGPATWNSPLFLKLAGGGIDGFVYRAVYTDFFHFGDGGWLRFGKDFETQHGEKPGSFEYLIYGGVSLMLKAADGGGGDGRSFLESLEKLASSPEYRVKRDKAGSLRISPLPRILSVSRGEIIEIMKVR
ncbi:MAG TPA: ABC transporter substrate-binding protein [Thermodesulfobacteriota bacterium]|nr:ABC transporter substrate-binding protein [Thermodesulfobacteriota bacterium]